MTYGKDYKYKNCDCSLHVQADLHWYSQLILDNPQYSDSK